MYGDTSDNIPLQHFDRPQFQPTYHLAAAMHAAAIGNGKPSIPIFGCVKLIDK